MPHAAAVCLLCAGCYYCSRRGARLVTLGCGLHPLHRSKISLCDERTPFGYAISTSNWVVARELLELGGAAWSRRRRMINADTVEPLLGSITPSGSRTTKLNEAGTASVSSEIYRRVLVCQLRATNAPAIVTDTLMAASSCEEEMKHSLLQDLVSSTSGSTGC